MPDRSAQSVRADAAAAATQAANDAAANADAAANEAQSAASSAESAASSANAAAKNANDAADNANSAAQNVNATANVDGLAESVSGSDLVKFDGTTVPASSHDGEVWIVIDERGYYRSNGTGWVKDSSALAGVNADGELLDVPVARVDTITALQSTTPTPEMHRLVEGYHASGGRGGGTFYWDAGNTTAEDGGTVFESTVSGFQPGDANEGRWIRLYEGALSATWFGAKGDDTADDTQALQDALTAAAGAELYIPEGTYLLSDYLDVLSETTVRGAGRGTILKRKASSDLSDIEITDKKIGVDQFAIDAWMSPLLITDENAAPSTGITIRDLKLDGNYQNTSKPDFETGIWVRSAEDTDILNVSAENFRYDLTDADRNDGYQAFCILLTDASRTTIRGGLWERSGYECIGVRGGSRNTLIDGCKSTEGGKRHTVQAASEPAPLNTTMTDCFFESPRARFISHNGRGVILRGNTIINEDNSPCEILAQLDDSDVNDTVPEEITIVGNSFVQKFSGSGVNGIRIRTLDQGINKRVTITGNEIRARVNGVLVTGARGVAISDNTIYSDGRGIRCSEPVASVELVNISNNLINAGAGEAAVSVADSCERVDVLGNQMLGGDTGVFVGPSVNRMLIADNDLLSASTAGLDIDASATNITTRDNRT